MMWFTPSILFGWLLHISYGLPRLTGWLVGLLLAGLLAGWHFFLSSWRLKTTWKVGGPPPEPSQPIVWASGTRDTKQEKVTSTVPTIVARSSPILFCSLS